MVKYVMERYLTLAICIFSGTFNPIHDGHLKMAEYALKKYNFEKIIFIPAYIPPHKNVNPELAKHRYNMVKLAIQDNPKFEISDIEYKNEDKSYSLITVQQIIEQYQIKDRLNFIIGTDAFAKIDSWYKAEELKKLVHFIVFPRKGTTVEHIKGWNYELTDMDFVDISSTEIRNGKIRKTKAEGYIKENGLYKL